MEGTLAFPVLVCALQLFRCLSTRSQVRPHPCGAPPPCGLTPFRCCRGYLVSIINNRMKTTRSQLLPLARLLLQQGLGNPSLRFGVRDTLLSSGKEPQEVNGEVRWLPACRRLIGFCHKPKVEPVLAFLVSLFFFFILSIAEELAHRN